MRSRAPASSRRDRGDAGPAPRLRRVERRGQLGGFRLDWDDDADDPGDRADRVQDGFNAAKVYSEASPGVVTIRSIFAGSGDSGSPFGGASAAEGSGFVLNDSGEIVTNAHVVTDDAGGERKPAKAVFVEFPDRNVVPAQIIGFDPFADVALLKVKPDGFALIR